MGVLFPNSTDYVHRDEPNLLNLHKAMEYNADGKPHFRVTLGSDNITITGNVNVGTEIRVNNVESDPVPVKLMNTPLTVNQGTSPWTVSVSNWPSTQNVSGSVSVTNFPSTQNVSGTVNIGTMPEVEIKNDSGNPIPVLATINNTESNPTLVKFSDETNIQLDMTQRLRVNIPSQQWWYVPAIDKDGDLRFQESFVGSDAQSTFMQNLASINLTSGMLSGSSAKRGSRRRHKVRPGVSHQFITTHNWDGINPNVTKRRGMFTSYNGLFFEVSDKLYAVIRRRLLDGTLVETKIPVDEFRHDKLDGAGVSGFDFRTSTNKTLALTGYVNNSTVNVPIIGSSELVYNATFNTAAWNNGQPFSVGSKITITGVTPSTYNGVAMVQSITNGTITVSYNRNPGVYSSMSSGLLTYSAYHDTYTWWIDFNGGRSTKVRFGINGVAGPSVLHIEDFSGEIGTQYENAPALMDRTEIINTGVPPYIPSFTTAGSGFNIEADAELNPGFGVALSSIPITLTKNTNEEYAALGIGLRYGEPYQRGDLQVQGVNFVDISNINQQNSGVFQWRLVLNPTLTGTIPTPINVGKATQFWDYSTGVTVSGGINLIGGYAISTAHLDVSTALNFLNMGSNLDYTDADKVVLVIKQLISGTDNASIITSINFIEAL